MDYGSGVFCFLKTRLRLGPALRDFVWLYEQDLLYVNQAKQNVPVCLQSV